MNIANYLKKTALYPQWKKIGIHPHHGINIPLGSLKTHHSSGIGEFYDLLPLIDFCSEIGFDIIQLLPINDSGDDPSPYNALSSMALHPIYLSLKHLPYMHQYADLQNQLPSFQEYNRCEKIEYHSILKKKESFLRSYVALAGASLLQAEKYKDFLHLHPWVKSYSLYKALKTSMSFASWQTWPEDLASPSNQRLEELYQLHQNEVDYFSICQYLCFEQMHFVKTYAEKKKIFLKGDLPILISPDSADVWLERAYFNTDYQVGYPPDYYTEKGQLWGFPALCWDIIEKKNFNWWRQRLFVGSFFYHLYRLDHVAGFYRLWLIEQGKEPKDGCYVPEDLDEAIRQGHHYLSIIPLFASMLPIAEDLGNIPPEMFDSLKTLGICGTRVLRWQRAWETDGSFIPFEDYEPLTMTCVSTHDSSTLAQWWSQDQQEAQEYAAWQSLEYDPILDPATRFEILKKTHSSASLFHINLFPEYLALIPEFVSEDIDQERINIPGKILPTNWTYRLKKPLEEITSHQGFKTLMRQLTD